MWIRLNCTEQAKTFRKLIRFEDISSIEDCTNDSCNFKTKINIRDGVTLYVTDDFDKIETKLLHEIP